MSEDQYLARAVPRLAALDALTAKIDFGSQGWRFTDEGQRYMRLLEEQSRDEVAAGI